MNATTRTAIVTGASGGIGRAVAGRLARDGFAVVLNYAGNAANADKAVAELRAAGAQALALKANVADAGEVAQLFKATVEKFGGVDVVVHCAGIMPMRLLAEDPDLSLFDQVININLRGSYAVMTTTLPMTTPPASWVDRLVDEAPVQTQNLAVHPGSVGPR